MPEKQAEVDSGRWSRKLPSRQRTAIVLRYWEELTEVSADYTARTWTRGEFSGGVENHTDRCSGPKWLGGVPGDGSAADLQSMIQSGLAPTAANLAQLTVPVPPGFREVSAHG
jgi:hypothetical protein